MTDFSIHAPALFDGESLRHDISVHVKNGLIAEVTPGKAPNAIELKPGTLLAPGFIDTQVNGGGGVLLNDNPSPAAIATIAAAHRRFGVTSFLPTLISDTREKMKLAIAAVDAAIAQGQHSVLGIHLEGPFLNPARKGVHPESHLIKPEESDIELLSSLKNGATLVTLAPEMAPPGFISKLKQRGVIVAAGHTDASCEQIDTALQQGVTGFTHLYNAMSQLNSRAPGAVGACLADNNSFAGIIADGHHVAPAALRVALKAKSAAKLFLVSDAMSALGADMTEFSLFGRKVLVQKGKLVTEDGTLAGAQLDMASAVRYMNGKAGATIEEALSMATSTPAEFLGLAHKIGRIKPGLRADFVALDEKNQVRQTWLMGQVCV